MHVVFGVASFSGLVGARGGLNWPPFAEALCDTIRECQDKGYEVTLLVHSRNPYIQAARNELVAEFLETEGDVLFFLDDDLSWEPSSVLCLLQMSDEVVAGTYRMKCEEERYCGVLFTDAEDKPIARKNGALAASQVATGFLRITRAALVNMILGHPEQRYTEYDEKGEVKSVMTDLFPQGVYNGRWVGEDYAFCRLWKQLMGEIWLVPNLNITHWDRATGASYPGNFHEFLLKQPGGSNAPREVK